MTEEGGIHLREGSTWRISERRIHHSTDNVQLRRQLRECIEVISVCVSLLDHLHPSDISFGSLNDTRRVSVH